MGSKAPDFRPLASQRFVSEGASPAGSDRKREKVTAPLRTGMRRGKLDKPGPAVKALLVCLEVQGLAAGGVAVQTPVLLVDGGIKGTPQSAHSPHHEQP